MRTGIITLLKMAFLVGLIPTAVGGYKLTDHYLPDTIMRPVVWFLGFCGSLSAIHLYNHYLKGLFTELRIDTSIHHFWIFVCVVKWAILAVLGLLSIPLCIYFSYEIFLQFVKTNVPLSQVLGGTFGVIISLLLQELLVGTYLDEIAKKVGEQYPHGRK